MNEYEQKIKLVMISTERESSSVSRQILGLLSNLNQEKFDLFLICEAGDFSEDAKRINGVRVKTLSSKQNFIKQLFSVRSKILDIKTIGYPFQPMIIHSHGFKASILSRTLIPVKAASIVTIYNIDGISRLNRLKRFIFNEFLRFLNYSRTDLLITPSSPVRRFLIDNELASKEKTIIAPSVDDMSDNLETKKIKEINKEPIIGISGMNWDKSSIDRLLLTTEALLHKYPLASLEIITDEQNKNLLDRRISSKSYDNHITVFSGEKGEKVKLKDWDICLILPLPLIYDSSILNNCMNIGVPIVGDFQILSGIIKDDKNGLLFKSESPSKIIQKISEVVGHPAKAAKLKKEASKSIKEYVCPKNSKIFEKIYQNII